MTQKIFMPVALWKHCSLKVSASSARMPVVCRKAKAPGPLRSGEICAAMALMPWKVEDKRIWSFEESCVAAFHGSERPRRSIFIHVHSFSGF